LALFDYVLRGGGRQTHRRVLEGALKPIIVLGAVIAFLIYLAVHRSPPIRRGPTEVKFFAPSAMSQHPAPPPTPSGK